MRDGVAAMMLLLQKGPVREPINICSGKAHKIKDILDMLIEISGCDVEIRYNENYRRPSDETILVGDNTKLTQLGWKQKYTIEQTLERVYSDWLSRT